MALLDAAARQFLDLVLLAGDPRFEWGHAELRAALQWAGTLQQLAGTAAGGAALQSHLEALRPRVPAGMQAALPTVAERPLHAMLDALLCRPGPVAAASSSSGGSGSGWLEAVLAAFATVVLAYPDDQREAAEQALLGAASRLQQAGAARALLADAARQAAAAAAARLELSGTGSAPLAAEQRALLVEALRHMSSPVCLQCAAAAQLLAQRAQQLADDAEQRGQAAPDAQAAAGNGAAAAQLAGLLHSPPTELELELLCLVALLPGWEPMLRRLAGLDSGSPALQASSESSGCGDGSDAHAGAAAGQALALLCAACASQPGALLALHPALLAEVCRCSFRFTAAFAPVLAGHVREAEAGTRSVAEAARWRAAHATKHADHVSDYLAAKGCQPGRPDGAAPVVCSS